MKILVVDDDAAQRFLMKDYLSEEGWDVSVAENGEEALEEMASEKMDIVVSDVYMPVMDGVKLRKTIREIPGYEAIPFLFISAFNDEQTVDVVRDPKIEGFMQKGRPAQELKDWVLFLSTPEKDRPRFAPGKKPKW